MRILTSIFVFFLALGLQTVTVASETKAETTAPTCNAETDKNCTEESHKNNHNSHGSSKDWSHKRQEQVASIFPEKQKDPTATVRPEKVKLEAPKFNSTIEGNTAKLEWTASEGAQVYHVQVSKDAGFNNRSMYVYENKNVAATSVEVPQLEPGVTYFWRVAAYNGNQHIQFTKSVFSSSSFKTK